MKADSAVGPVLFATQAGERKDETVPLDQAVSKALAEAKAKFTETLEVHVNLATDPKRSVSNPYFSFLRYLDHGIEQR